MEYASDGRIGSDGINASSSKKEPLDHNIPSAPEPQAGPFPMKEELEKPLSFSYILQE